MRVAILADIHGNLHALEAALGDIERMGADRVIVNGDLVNRGPHNVEVLERVLGLSSKLDPTLVLGNHDDLLRKWVDGDDDIPREWFDDPFWQGTAWCAEQLQRAGLIGALRNLPMQARACDQQVLVTHGSPRHYREGYGRHLSDDRIAEIVRDFPARAFVGSHTHRPMRREWSGHLVLNTGAVGAPFNGDPRAQYLVLTENKGILKVEWRAIAYDREAALAGFATSGYLNEGELSARIYFEELRLARSLWTPFWIWTEQREQPRDWTRWQEFYAGAVASFVPKPAVAPTRGA